jgi:hypothetical protein
MFRQHVPNYVDTKFKRVDDANTLEEVLDINWVKKWTESTDHSFYMWTKSGRTLIALFDNGEYWWTVGYADFDLDLPKFSDHRINKPVEPKKLEDGISIQSDGRSWYILRPNEDNTGYVGFRESDCTWHHRNYNRYPTRQCALDVMRGKCNVDLS